MKNIIFLVVAIAACGCEKAKNRDQEIEEKARYRRDSVINIINIKYDIENRLDTILNSNDFTLFYQRLFKNEDDQLLEVKPYDISDIYVRDSTYYLMLTISGRPWNDIFLELTIKEKELKTLFGAKKSNAFLIINIQNVKKVYFEMKANISESVPEEDYYDIDLNLAGTRKLILEGNVRDVYPLQK